MNEKIIIDMVEAFACKKKEMPTHFADDDQDRIERRRFFQKFESSDILNMSEDDFCEYLGKLWSMIMWGNKQKHVKTIINDNGFEKIKTQLVELLYGKTNICKRWDRFAENVKGFGPATMSELLTYVDPKNYAIINRVSLTSLKYLGVDNIPKYTYQQNGEKYLELCDAFKTIANIMKDHGFPEADLLLVDYFMWDEIYPMTDMKTVEPRDDTATKDMDVSDVARNKSFHNEIRDMIVAIGELLGFESSAEVKVADGAVVDAVWEAKIGNMGKAIYVFEVQSKGSIDSLVLNLKKAQSNAAVQAVVAVSDEKQLEKILVEAKNVIDDDSLRTWEINDVIATHNALERAHESINRLALVPDSF